MQLADDVAYVVGATAGEQARQDDADPPQAKIQPQRGEQVSTRGEAQGDGDRRRPPTSGLKAANIEIGGKRMEAESVMNKSILEIHERMRVWVSVVQPVLFKSINETKRRLAAINVPCLTGVSKNEE